MTVRMRRRKQTLIEQRHRRLETYYKRAKILRESWPFPPSEKKVVIHLPSLGYPKRFFVKNVLSTSWNYRFNTFLTKYQNSIHSNRSGTASNVSNHSIGWFCWWKYPRDFYQPYAIHRWPKAILYASARYGTSCENTPSDESRRWGISTVKVYCYCPRSVIEIPNSLYESSTTFELLLWGHD